MPVRTTTVTMIGAGNYGTAFAKLLAERGHRVTLWNWEGDQKPLKQIKRYQENKAYLKGIVLPDTVIPVMDLEEACYGSSAIFFALPSSVFRSTFLRVLPYIQDSAYVINLSKGVDPKTKQLLPLMMAEELPRLRKKNVVTISGPAIARQLAGGVLTYMAIAAKDTHAREQVQQLVQQDHLRLIPTSDVVGVSIGGAFKNVYAIAMGMCDGVGLDLNTKSALLTEAMEEVAALAKSMVGKRDTIFGLAGLGDLIGTALSPDSRNRHFGECLANGLSVSAAYKKVGQTVEGIDATKVFVSLAKKHTIDAPFANMVYRSIVRKQANAGDILRSFLKL